MRLPRRVPWVSISELDRVCSWIYATQDDLDSQLLALNRLAAWKTITSLPHALESTYSLLAVIVKDKTEKSSSSFLSLRQAYATALIRLVNGLVDPLQLGVYARSISAIANQLGLPSWLVELRHAATHEDLPSLELLRDAAKESMQWLLHNYFLPLLHPASLPRSRAAMLRPISPLLDQYKRLFKSITGDVTLMADCKRKMRLTLREIERWVAEAEVAAKTSAVNDDWEIDHQYPNSVDIDPKEGWALDRLCDGLLERGALVPLSMKERAVFASDGVLSPQLVALWEPLFIQLHAHHPAFPRTLINNIVARLSLSNIHTIDRVGEPPGERHDSSYNSCIAKWAAWVVHKWIGVDPDIRQRTMVYLATALGPEFATNEASLLLLKSLTAGYPDLEPALQVLYRDARIPPAFVSGNADVVGVMDKRLRALLARMTVNDPPISHAAELQPLTDPREITVEVASGWRRLSRECWKANPIGCFVPAEG